MVLTSTVYNLPFFLYRLLFFCSEVFKFFKFNLKSGSINFSRFQNESFNKPSTHKYNLIEIVRAPSDVIYWRIYNRTLYHTVAYYSGLTFINNLIIGNVQLTELLIKILNWGWNTVGYIYMYKVHVMFKIKQVKY